MGVSVHRQRDGRMPGHRLSGFRVDPAVGKVGDERVSQAVEVEVSPRPVRVVDSGIGKVRPKMPCTAAESHCRRISTPNRHLHAIDTR